MHHSRLSTFVIDCRSETADGAARFWSAALGRPIESADGNSRQLSGTADEPILLVQKVDHPGRIHLDIETDDMEAEVKRLEGLGARRVVFVKTWWVMEDRPASASAWSIRSGGRWPGARTNGRDLRPPDDAVVAREAPDRAGTGH